MQRNQVLMTILGSIACFLNVDSVHAEERICEEMVVKYTVRLDKLKHDLEEYKDKVPAESIEIIEESMGKIEQDIAKVSHLREKGMHHPECASLYNQIALQTRQVASKISRFSDLDVLPLQVNIAETSEQPQAVETALTSTSSKP